MPPPLDLVSPLLEGLVVTLKLFAGGAALALVMAFVGGLSRLSKHWPLRWLALAYIETFRGTSVLVQLFWFYFVLPFFGINLPGMTVGVLVLGLNVGAYGSEIVRGAVQSVPKGQHEAAIALNFTPRQTLWRIVIPQAIIAMLPPMGNLLIELLKATALVSLITISDLTFVAQTLRSDTLRTAEIFSLVLVMYFAVALCLTGSIRLLEKRFGEGLDIGGIK